MTEEVVPAGEEVFERNRVGMGSRGRIVAGGLLQGIYS